MMNNIVLSVANSVYNQLLGIKLRKVSLYTALMYLVTESHWQRNSCMRTLAKIPPESEILISQANFLTIKIGKIVPKIDFITYRILTVYQKVS